MVRDARNDGRRTRAGRARGRADADTGRARRSQPSTMQGTGAFAEIDDFGEFGTPTEPAPSRRASRVRESEREQARTRRVRRSSGDAAGKAKRARKTSSGKEQAGSRKPAVPGFVGGIADRLAGMLDEDMTQLSGSGGDGSEALLTRDRFVFGLFGLVALVATGQLFRVQIVEHDYYTDRAERPRKAEDKAIRAKRGTVFDRNGNVLASTISTRQVILDPSHQISDDNRVVKKVAFDTAQNAMRPVYAQRIADAVGGDASEYESVLANTKLQYYLVARQVDLDVAETLEDIPAVTFAEDTRRICPYDDVAGQVIGVTDANGEGLTGIEKYYEAEIHGVDGSITVEKGANGEPIPDGTEELIPAIDGDEVVLSLDLELQQYAQAKVQAAVEEWEADSGEFVIMDAATGEVFAVGSTPYLNASDFAQADAAAFNLKPVSAVYEPGSTFKCITAAALLNEGAITADSQIDVESVLKIDDFDISDSHAHGDLVMSFRDVIAESSNIGTVNASRLIPRETFYDYIERFGFTSRSGIDYPGDTAGLLLALEDWNEATAMNVPFGQGISCSSMQLIRALATIRNGGVMCTPHLLIEKPQDPSFAPEWPEERVLSEQACDDLNDILASVVEYGTGTDAAIEGYTVVGKTGTAQKIDSETGKYSDVEYVTSFVGWLPYTDCTLVCLVSLDNPKTAAGGGLVAAPVFADIMSFACDRYKVTPDASSTAGGVSEANGGADA